MASKSVLPTTPITYAEGDGAHLGEATNKSSTFRAYALDNMSKPVVTRETFAEYKSASDMEQNRLKRIAGWTIRCAIEGKGRSKNTVTPSQIITLDVDNATPEFQEELLNGEVMPSIALAANTTRSHTPEKPRFRIALPVKTPISPDDYQRACRICAMQFDPELKIVDKVSARPAQLMYRPSCSKDMERHFRYYEQDGDAFDWEAAVKTWERETGLDSNVLPNLPRFYNESELREVAEKAEDPLEKKGPVGFFCRAYSITELIEGKDGEDPILDGIYQIDDWVQGAADRMTYIPGHSQNGAVVYEDKFVYSHHGSDPAGDQLVNAWDLVRIHLFDGKDDDPEKPMAQRDSWKRMTAFAKDLDPYKRQMGLDRYDMAAMLDDLDEGDWVEQETADDLLGYDHMMAEQRQQDEALDDLLGVPYRSVADVGPSRYQRLLAEKPPKDWIATELELDQNGNIKPTLTNIAIIVGNDSRLWRKIAFNEFSNQVVLLADIKTRNSRLPTVTCRDKERGTNWSDINDIVIRAIIEGPAGPGLPGYGTKVSDRDLIGGVKLAARRNSFHPIRDKLNRHRKEGWDGEDRISTFFSRHLGAEQNAYTAQVFRMMMIASVARIETPGCKFDYCCVLQGGQGIGKSTTIKLIYGEDYFGELDVDLSDRKAVAEQIAGKWGNEIPELSAFTKSDHNHSKAFLRRQHDDVRMSYDRTVTELPRQCVVWGTTNDDQVLRDATGNRSYWLISCGDNLIDFAAILNELDQLWAQAVYEHDQMRAKYPRGDLPLTLTGEALQIAIGVQEDARQKEMWEEWVEDIVEWFERPIHKGSLLASIGADIDDLAEDDSEMVFRVGFTQHQAAVGALGLREGAFTNPTQQMSWNKAKAELVRRGYQIGRCRSAGVVGRWIFPPDTDPEDIRRGYILTDEAEPTSDSPSPDDDLI